MDPFLASLVPVEQIKKDLIQDTLIEDIQNNNYTKNKKEFQNDYKTSLEINDLPRGNTNWDLVDSFSTDEYSNRNSAGSQVDEYGSSSCDLGFDDEEQYFVDYWLKNSKSFLSKDEQLMFDCVSEETCNLDLNEKPLQLKELPLVENIKSEKTSFQPISTTKPDTINIKQENNDTTDLKSNIISDLDKKIKCDFDKSYEIPTTTSYNNYTIQKLEKDFTRNNNLMTACALNSNHFVSSANKHFSTPIQNDDLSNSNIKSNLKNFEIIESIFNFDENVDFEQYSKSIDESLITCKNENPDFIDNKYIEFNEKKKTFNNSSNSFVKHDNLKYNRKRQSPMGQHTLEEPTIKNNNINEISCLNFENYNTNSLHDVSKNNIDNNCHHNSAIQNEREDQFTEKLLNLLISQTDESQNHLGFLDDLFDDSKGIPHNTDIRTNSFDTGKKSVLENEKLNFVENIKADKKIFRHSLPTETTTFNPYFDLKRNSLEFKPTIKNEVVLNGVSTSSKQFEFHNLSNPTNIDDLSNQMNYNENNLRKYYQSNVFYRNTSLYDPNSANQTVPLLNNNFFLPNILNSTSLSKFSDDVFSSNQNLTSNSISSQFFTNNSTSKIPLNSLRNIPINILNTSNFNVPRNIESPSTSTNTNLSRLHFPLSINDINNGKVSTLQQTQCHNSDIQVNSQNQNRTNPPSEQSFKQLQFASQLKNNTNFIEFLNNLEKLHQQLKLSSLPTRKQQSNHQNSQKSFQNQQSLQQKTNNINKNVLSSSSLSLSIPIQPVISTELIENKAKTPQNLNNQPQKSTSSQKTKKSSIHACPFNDCNKVYKSLCHLRAHIKQHSGVKPYQCNWSGCEWSFSRSDELTRHYRKHSGDKPFKCKLCFRPFARSDHLKVHMKRHKNELAQNVSMDSKITTCDVTSNVDTVISSSCVSPKQSTAITFISNSV